jgi:hypothetical protein
MIYEAFIFFFYTRFSKSGLHLTLKEHISLYTKFSTITIEKCGSIKTIKLLNILNFS